MKRGPAPPRGGSGVGEVQHHQEEGEGGEVQHHQDEGEGGRGPAPQGEVWERVKSDYCEVVEEIVVNNRYILFNSINLDHRVSFLILLIAHCTRRKNQSVRSKYDFDGECEVIHDSMNFYVIVIQQYNPNSCSNKS